MESFQTGNALFAHLERNDPCLSGKFRELVIKNGTVLSSLHDQQNLVYFPCRQALLSLRTVVSPELAIECGTIGSEGAWPIGRIDQSNILVKAFRGGRVLCLDTRTMQETLQRSPSLRAIFEKYSADLLKATMQFAVCNAAHSVDQRLARWLLQMADGAETNVLYTTHEDVASILGIGRSYATRILAKLSDLGAVRSRRGLVEITNSDALRSVSCGCEARMRRETTVPLEKPGTSDQFVDFVGVADESASSTV